jgi:hypothetical protein
MPVIQPNQSAGTLARRNLRTGLLLGGLMLLAIPLLMAYQWFAFPADQQKLPARVGTSGRERPELKGIERTRPPGDGPPAPTTRTKS